MKEILCGKLSLTESFKFRYVVSGLSWFVYAICNLFENSICHSISIFALIMAMASILLFFRRGEAFDEMATRHLECAKAFTLDLMYIFIILLGISSILGLNININFQGAYAFLIAGMDLFIGYKFFKLEKVGE